MSATAVQPLFDLFAAERQGRGQPQLQEWIDEIWADLRHSGAVECPICHGQMERAGDRGRCTRCGGVLS